MKHVSLFLLALFAVSVGLCGCLHHEPVQQPEPEPEVEAPAEDPIGPISVTGQAAEKTGPNVNPVQAKLGAQRGARVEAYRRLFEQIAGLQLDSQTQVRDFVTSYDQIHTRTGGYLDTPGLVHKAVEAEEGLWEVTIELTAEEVRELIDAINAGRNR
ncbi:MAG: hypothetical protein E3J72_11535 [Planctomycetota bacterium]|nr:MAG: hypothetical protein E3J72_11535 [Planctomycetota bacterium]